MKRYIYQRVLSFLLISALLPTLTACGEQVQAKNVMKDVVANDVSGQAKLTEEGVKASTQFAVRLFRESIEEGQNSLISPISVLFALAMTANGAKEDTLAQMEQVFGLSIEELNGYLCAYQQAITDTKKSRLHMANSIWVKELKGFSTEENFLQTNADYYGAQIYQAPFNQQTTKDINQWVDRHTDGMIQSLLEEPIEQDVVMYLINALAFDAEWQSIYKKNQVRDGVFTREDGEAQQVKLMYSEEYAYLEDEMATGFLKYYADNKYAFVALLPKEDVKVSEYVSWLTADHLSGLLNQPVDMPVRAAIPQFTYEDSMNMGEALRQMGMVDAFDEDKANFSGIGSARDGRLVINRVLHKTHIAVDERGTKAGAVTAVEVNKTSAMPEETKRVYLDRPFLYMIIDCETKSPLFMGTMMSIETNNGT